MDDLTHGLLEWRIAARACRKCTLLPDGTQIDPSDPIQLAHAQIHYETRNRPRYSRGWATAMLDKRPEAECQANVLQASLESKIMAVLEAPNEDDTYNLDKGYLTVDQHTDETGKFTHRLFNHIGISAERVLFANAVQCLPARDGTKYPVTKRQRDNCRENLRLLVSLVQPKAIVAFGNEALRSLHRFEPFRLHGRALRLAEVTVGQMIGQVVPGWWSTNVVPLFHPSPLVRANAFCKDGRPGTGRSEGDQLKDIEIIIRVVASR